MFMKMKRLISLLLLLMFSFSIAHAFIVENEHSLDMNEYVHEFSHSSHLDSSHDKNNIHCEFHIPYILVDKLSQVSNELINSVVLSKIKYINIT